MGRYFTGAINAAMDYEVRLESAPEVERYCAEDRPRQDDNHALQCLPASDGVMGRRVDHPDKFHFLMRRVL